MNNGSGTGTGTGTPENLAQIMQQMLTDPSGMLQTVQTSLDEDDNEIVVQYLLTSFTTLLQLPGMRDVSTSLNDVLDGFNIALACMGYTMHHRQISRNELKNFIYYARITPDGQMLRSQHHPIRLRELMTTMPDTVQIPDAFEKMFVDQDYLPNIMNVWDRGHNDSLIFLSFQKVNLHFQPPPGPSRTVPQSTANLDSELESDSGSESSLESSSDSSSDSSSESDLMDLLRSLLGYDQL